MAPLVSKGEIAGLSEVAGEEPPYFLSTGEGAGATPLSDAVKIPAGWLVEQAGFHKGYREQGVGISPNHALALVNYEGTTEELLQLARNIQERVYRRFRIQLEQEPVAVPYKLP